ncbi:hypothetical protein P153DRAFT_331556 [Dothidotthia symphoricarpi CBS 119687]|uniref:Uncharacterized protein n=1 Tax=Dothidotthia symphoricarpi CBS 119687 TaxID=1392245 RepID=A0A6A6ANL2_9PLEO|nr:uncharacterized protein P153DRAFT_331556 [Dothidotthia symphoricarpi CBS 119687]KAF2133126.1 hypothetical protein P153DRAFT_331556 [Dothidotthia symphoricarpi CBS 119687]
MERTPSPSRRVHTPPGPLHGDNWQPFSPRRSSRVAQRSLHHEQTIARTRRDVTPTSTAKHVARALAFDLSPPTSPVSPPKHRTPRSVRRAHHEPAPFDSDSDHAAPTPARRFLSTMAPGMLPTPAKTPRKRTLQAEDSLGQTARVLFPNRPATIDEVMPTPRKSRKLMKNFSTLESFAQDQDKSSEKIEIFTDSKERVPIKDDSEENPFVVKKSKRKAKAKTTPQKSRRLDQRTQKMNDAVDRDAGMVYIFRGRKIFRKFHSGPPSNASEAEDDTEDGEDVEDDMHQQVKRSAGHEAHRPLTRSSIKPRLLFQKEIEQRKRENGEDDDDEEADTDIEVSVSTPSRRKGKSVVHLTQPIQEASPPPTVRKPKREISFDSWSRVKSAHSSSSSAHGSKKRSGEPLERDTDKRLRSEHFIS